MVTSIIHLPLPNHYHDHHFHHHHRSIILSSQPVASSNMINTKTKTCSVSPDTKNLNRSTYCTVVRIRIKSNNKNSDGVGSLFWSGP